ncbi:MAG: ABC transporter [Candidatus Cloacimonadota bacterium]|nr:MAG: ABC transporter [Candidatus Cloacimonadota bacterium]
MIRVENLTKDYGKLRAVDHINFQVNDSEILGFLGPNGAGKSTTLRILTCFMTPNSGNVYYDNKNIYDNSLEIRKEIGYLPEDNPLYYDMTVFDFLHFVAKIRQIPTTQIKSKLSEIIEVCGLKQIVHKKIDALSKGYKQRVGLAQAIIHDPKVLILDEPTTGLDPNQIIEIRNLIKELGKEKTVIISTHILQEVQATCERIIIINNGKLVADGTPEDLQTSFHRGTRLIMDLKNIAEQDIVNIEHNVPNVSLLKIQKIDGTFRTDLELKTEADIRENIFNYIVDKKGVILEMHRESISLEEIFRNLTIEDGGKVQ